MSGLRLTKRGRPLALAVSAGLILVALTAGCAGTAAAPRAVGAPGTTGSARLSSQASSATTPRYFLDLVQFSGAVSGGQLQVRRSATGALVSQAGSPALGVAPLGRSRFVVAEPAASNSCASRLYRTSISAAGRLRPLSRFGPVVHGQVVSLAAAADARSVGYFVRPCWKSASGYLGVLNVRTGRVRRWGDVNVEGSAGDISACCSLSLSADGRLAIFGGAALGPRGVITGQRVWALATSARAGTLARRSRVVLARPESGPQFDSVLLRPDGTSFYLCAVSTYGTPSAHRTVTQAAVVTARQTSDGAPIRTLATLTASGATFESEGFGCPIAASPAGNYLLVAYSLRYARVTTTGPLVRAARVDIATKARTQISFRLPGSAGMSVASGISIAW